MHQGSGVKHWISIESVECKRCCDAMGDMWWVRSAYTFFSWSHPLSVCTAGRLEGLWDGLKFWFLWSSQKTSSLTFHSSNIGGISNIVGIHSMLSTTYQNNIHDLWAVHKISSWFYLLPRTTPQSLFTGLVIVMIYTVLTIYRPSLSWFSQLRYVSSWRSSLVFGKFLFVSDVWLQSNNLSSIKRLVQSRCIVIVSVVDRDRGCGSLPSSGVNLVMPNHREVWVELSA